MFSIQERYSQAIRSSNLTCDVNTTFSDLDVIGAMALADRRLAQGPRPRIGAGAVSRLLAGDVNSTGATVRLLTERIMLRAANWDEPLTELWAARIVKTCVAWLLYGTCEDCEGLGHPRQKGAPVLSDRLCPTCGGSGKRSFVSSFRHEHKEIAQWLVREIAADLGVCGNEALRALAPRGGNS